MGFTHSRPFVRRLQQAHADCLEAEYTGLSRRPGNPDLGVERGSFPSYYRKRRLTFHQL